MRRIRIGKDINIKWVLYAPSDVVLTRENLTIELKDPKGRSFQCEYIFDTSVVEGYVVVVSLIGKNFNILGNYTLSAWLNKGMSGQSVVDAVNAFTLVETTLSEDKTKECGCGHLMLETVDIQSDFFFIGPKGEKGNDGFSPIINTTKSGATTTVHIQDKYGEKSFLIKDGEKGETGQRGEKGEKGEKGERGEQGLQGIQGIQGERGLQGEQGIQGVAGKDGQNGADGQPGFSPIATVSKSGDTATISITDKNGTTTATVKDGSDASITIDPTPTQNSTNAVSSGGVYSAIASIPAPTPEIFWATYGTTTAAEIQTALDAGKEVLCYESVSGTGYHAIYTLTTVSSTYYFVANIQQGQFVYSLTLNSTTNVWGRISKELQLKSLLTSTSTTAPSNSNYYSALATKNLVDAVDGKIGQPASLTFTYDDNTTQTYSLLTSNS